MSVKEEIVFEKYRQRGAYHWRQYFGGVFKVDCFLRARYHVVIHLLHKALVKKDSSVLEVGCGDGALSGLIFKTFGCQLTGVDPSTEGIRFCGEMFAKHGYQGSFYTSEGYHFNFPDEHFDHIVLADVIEHVQHPDRMLEELRRLLKPGGHLVITTPIRSAEYPDDKMHVQEFFPGELLLLCQSYFGNPVKAVYSHPLVWYELYTSGRKFNRSLIRFYCRVMDKFMNRNIFFTPGRKDHWQNYKQQGLLLRRPV